MKKCLLPLLAAFFMLPTVNNAQNLENIDEIAPFSEGLAAVRRGNQWGFINEQGTLVIDFRTDLHWKKDADISRPDVDGIRYPIFREGRCLITGMVEDGIPLYGFIDKSGKVVIEPQFLNIYPFEAGYTTGVLFNRTFRGENEFKLKIYEFKFFDVLVNVSGEIEEYLQRRNNIHMTKRRYTTPAIGARQLAGGLIAVHGADNQWEIRKLVAEN